MDWFSQKIEQLVPPSTIEWLDGVSASVNQALKQRTDELAKKYEYYMARPASVNCDKCNLELTVPEECWKWVCEACKTTNASDATECSRCEREKPEDFEPFITCVCGEVVILPSSNAYKFFSDFSNKGNQAVESAVKSIQDLNAEPSDFNCNFCDTQISYPRIWQCPTCYTTNPPMDDENPNTTTTTTTNIPEGFCARCHNPRPRPLCPKCNNQPEIPSSVWKNKLKSTWKSADRLAMISYYNLRKIPFHCCSRCGEPNSLEELILASGMIESSMPQVAELVCSSCKSIEVVTLPPPPPPPPSSPPPPLSSSGSSNESGTVTIPLDNENAAHYTTTDATTYTTTNAEEYTQ